MWTIITLQSAQTKATATVSAKSCFDAMFVFNITRSWRDLSTQENFRRKEKIVKIFQLLTMIFSENFLFVEIFLEWKWAFMTCRGRTILRTECLVFCSDGVPCDIQKTLYISLVISHLIYASQVLSPCLHGSIHLRQYKGGRFILRGFELLTLCYFLLDLLLLFHCINGKIGLYISEFVRLSHSETHCGSSGVDLRLTLLAHLANHILSVSALLLSPVASVEQFSKFI